MKWQKFCVILLLPVALVAGTPALDTVRILGASGAPQEIYTVQKGTTVKEGRFISYYPDGKVGVESTYRNGKLDGTFKSYYASGSLWQEVSYAAGVEQGESRLYYENGNLKNREVYESGVPNGLFKEWDENGALRSEFP